MDKFLDKMETDQLGPVPRAIAGSASIGGSPRLQNPVRLQPLMIFLNLQNPYLHCFVEFVHLR